MSPARGVFAGLAMAASLMAPAAARPAAQAPLRVPGFEQTQTWIRIVRTHTIGSIDDAARTVAGWSPVALQQVRDDLQLIRLLVVTASRQGSGAAAGAGFWGGAQGAKTQVEFRGRRLTLSQLATLVGWQASELFDPPAMAAPDSPARRALAQVMIQGALLHTDIAMASAVDLPAAGARSAATVVQLRDGREVAVGSATVHYAIAREAIALVLPATVGTLAARQWYYATLAFLQGERNYAAMLPHLETARATLPADARIWLLSGVAYENLAAPAVQVAVDSAGSTARIDAPMILLARAEAMFRHALGLDPRAAEPRLRLGRVLDLTGRHDEAAAMLAQAEAGLASDTLRYYAALFAGRAAESRGYDAEAGRAYERAMALFPQAQSPRLSLAEMAWRDADDARAQSGVHALFLTAQGDRSTDPWWVYDVSLVLEWPRLVAEMRQAAAQVVAR